MKRSDFFSTTGDAVVGSMLANSLRAEQNNYLPDSSPVQAGKKKVALVGTGFRGISFWGKPVQNQYNDRIEFVGLFIINPGRLEFAKKTIGINCPTFANFDEMLVKTKPELVIVTTVDAAHHTFIVKALKFRCDVVSDNFGKTELIKVPLVTAGHGGGDTRLQDRIFRNPEAPDLYKHSVGSYDGAMSSLLGIAARKSILENRVVKIGELTDIAPHTTRGII